MLKLDRPLVFFDLETTGVSVAQDKIVQMAAIKLWPDGRGRRILSGWLILDVLFLRIRPLCMELKMKM